MAPKGSIRSHWCVDILLVAALCTADLAVNSTLWTRWQELPTPVVIAFAAPGFVLLLWRRQAPYLVFGALCLYSVIAGQWPGLGYFPTLGPVLGIYTIGVYRGARPAGYALAAFLGTCVLQLAYLLDRTGGGWRTAATVSANLVGYGVAALAAGVVVRQSRRLGQVEAREAVAAERMRVARELHDIVAHSVTVMLLQAAGARKMLVSQPARAESALAEIEDTGKRAMDELRRLLTVLRGTDSPAALPPISREPQPGLADLDRLLARVREAGLRVDLCPTGRPGRLDASVDLTAYRIVQEALTNVSKHAAPGAHATVGLVWTDDRLTVEVVDDGPRVARPAAPSGGYGLVGLRERAALVGGQLSAAHTPSGGFAVTATLPLSGGASS